MAGNKKYQIANQLEQDQLREYSAFLDKGRFHILRVPQGYKQVNAQIVVHVKYDGCHKAHCIADGQDLFDNYGEAHICHDHYITNFSNITSLDSYLIGDILTIRHNFYHPTYVCIGDLGDLSDIFLAPIAVPGNPAPLLFFLWHGEKPGTFVLFQHKYKMVLKDENGTTRKIFPLVLRMGQDDDGNTIGNDDRIGNFTNKTDHDFSSIIYPFVLDNYKNWR